ncbi:MAG: 4-(cytidine 5'-diphospho)-2-C-methyl-D-erythritol kinase [Candidatus Omnitrophica bacterium]|nr:4-(cytidine 5'-diphospho)-2-C-methyl-D-erythritol kinase [Candidatus Omnitrophota bacterium]
MDSQLIVSQKSAKNFYGSKIKVLSPAKLNLYLNILGKYPSGFHEIESIAERISLSDEITVIASKNNNIRIFCNKKNLANENNLCVRAAKLIKEKYGLKAGFDIHLFKRIPVGAGLGGGSSNAASTILAIDELCKLNLSRDSLYRIGSLIGSDVNFFLAQSRFALICGRGEKVKPIQGKTLKHTVIWPGVFLSTKRVYSLYRGKLTKFLNNANILSHALKKGDACLVKNSIFNALENSALCLCVELSAAKNKLFESGIFAKVTGSGSAMYTLCEGSLQRKVRSILPKKYFVFHAQTF